MTFRAFLVGMALLVLLVVACAGGVLLGIVLAREGRLPAWASSPTPIPPTPAPTPTPSPVPSPARPPRTPVPAPPSPEETPTASSGTATIPDLPDPDVEALRKGLAPWALEWLRPDDPRPWIQMAIRVEPERRRLRGRMRVTYRNREGVPLSAICFRAFANARSSGGSRMEVGDVRVGEQHVPPIWSPDRTAFTVTLPAALPPGSPVQVTMIFTTTLGVRESGYGLMRAHPDGRMVVYYGYPEVARVANGRCVLDPPWENGDLHQAKAAHFWIRLALPEGMEAAISGVEVASREGEREAVAPFARNVALVVGPMERRTMEAKGLRVNGFFLKADEGNFEQGMEDALDALERFGEAFGPYPFPELDVVEAPLGGGAAGVEASGLILIGEDLYEMGDMGALLGSDLDVPGFVIAHEAAHQWWYGMVGNDAHREPWLDEALTNWSAVWWMEQKHGRAAAEAAWDALVLLPYRLRLMEGDLPLDLPAERYSELDYVAIVYGKGAWMYEVLRREMGEERFFDFLRRYADRHRFGWASADSWKATLAEVWGRKEAEAFYEKWVKGKAITAADLPAGGMFGELLSDPGMGEMMRILLQILMASQP